MTMFTGVLYQACAARPLLQCLPGHSQQALVSLQRWQRSSSLAVLSGKQTRHYATPELMSAEPAEADSVAGAGVIKAQLQDLAKRVKQMMSATDPASQRSKLDKLEAQASAEGFWDQQDKAAAVNQEMSDINELLELTAKMQSQLEDVQVAVELIDMEESDRKEEQTFKLEAFSTLQQLAKALEQWETQQLLGGQYDKLGAILSIQAGAGGTDAQDWAEMLLRMYTRWADKQGFTTSVLSRAEGEEAGIKAAEVEVQGRYAFGYLSAEKGTHRLVRQSPFNVKGIRQTSFAAVDVTPVLGDQVKNIQVPDSDLDIQTMRASGAGGQHVNKTESAVRVRHIPSGLSVRIEDNRSQLMNKNKAIDVLKGRLLVIAQEQQLKEIKDIKGDAVKPDWGQQIRNYVFHPYKMVKDVRSGFETSNVGAVMDGDALDGFIEAQLRHRHNFTTGKQVQEGAQHH